MRGRVMALYAMAFLGTTPIGAPLVGAIAQWTNPRVALLVGAVATVLSAGLLMWRHQAGCGCAGPGPAPRGRLEAAELQAVDEAESATRADAAERRAQPAAAALGSFGRPEHPLADDVALDLGGAAPDRLGAGEEERRLQVADRVVVAAPPHTLLG